MLEMWTGPQETVQKWLCYSKWSNLSGVFLLELSTYDSLYLLYHWWFDETDFFNLWFPCTCTVAACTNVVHEVTLMSSFSDLHTKLFYSFKRNYGFSTVLKETLTDVFVFIWSQIYGFQLLFLNSFFHLVMHLFILQRCNQHLADCLVLSYEVFMLDQSALEIKIQLFMATF